jgi:hypothetical protein
VAYWHYTVATEGIRAGHTYFSVLGLKVSIQVVPVPSGGGSPASVWWPYEQVEYKVIVRIRRKDKEWVEERWVNPLVGKALEKVIARFTKFVQFINDITTKARLKTINIIQTIVKVRRK